MAHGAHHAPLLSLLADRPLTPEGHLWLAVVEQALADLASSKRHAGVAAWFRSPYDGPGSFVWICDRLDVRPASALAQVDAGIVLPREHTWAGEVRRIGLGRGKPLASGRRDAVR
jgi:hypothetical protein